MNILLAPDKFKGSMSALEVCNSIVKGLKKNNSNLNILSCPMADGGEGSLEIINHYLKLNLYLPELNLIHYLHFLFLQFLL